MKFGTKPLSLLALVVLILASLGQAQTKTKLDVRLPLKDKSVRFAVIGDSGTGEKDQYNIARQMEIYHQVVNFNFVIMLGDNIYGGHEPRDFEQKFVVPYKPLLDAGVQFYASLGNHDDPKLEPLYKPFNMNGERYYTFKKDDVQFFALDSNYMDAQQLSWLEKNLRSSNAHWKICYFHHPLYNEGKMHGPDLDLRNQLSPLIKNYGVNVVFSGHEHSYQRLKPVDNVYYFVQGDSGKLARHDFHHSNELAASFDRARTFMIVEIVGDTLYFQTIAEFGETVDSGALPHAAATVKAASAGR
ncbi:MAG TPA: metallophosphoesterase [Terriglobales bacterium]|jgi:predicted phosphodiesterase|nr:metallophosphoesterase [Terriglobales bacterium]